MGLISPARLAPSTTVEISSAHPGAKENKAKEAEARQKMRQEPYLLDASRRAIVLDSLHEVCNHKAWTLLAAHVRSNHIHVVIGANETAERVMNTLKAYASRALNAAGLDSADRNRWSRHGSAPPLVHT
jgi:REP element-mobilizing transposase RayT